MPRKDESFRWERLQPLERAHQRLCTVERFVAVRLKVDTANTFEKERIAGKHSASRMPKGNAFPGMPWGSKDS
jgi:hypothetical protein